MITKAELIQYLEDYGANEYTLAQIEGIQHIVVHMSDEPGISGYIYTKVKEGILCIPYGEVLPQAGYEQLELDKIKVVGKELLEVEANNLRTVLLGFKEMFEID